MIEIDTFPVLFGTDTLMLVAFMVRIDAFTVPNLTKEVFVKFVPVMVSPRFFTPTVGVNPVMVVFA